MSDSLLPYYERELDAIKRLAAEFADTHPKIAGRLRLSADAVDDPHVARLLEGVAFLAARVHHRLDDEFPELTDALLGLLYPHYLAPVPSCMVVQVRLPARPDESGAPARRRSRSTPSRCTARTLRYRTTAPVTLWPIEVENVRLSGLPIVAPANPLRRRRNRRAAHHAEMRLARGHLHPARRRPAALLPARPDQPDAGALRAAGRTRHLGRLRRQRGGSRAGHRARQRDRAGRLLAGRGAAALVGTRLLRLPAAHRVLRLSRRSSCSSTSPGSTPRPWCPAATGWRSSSTWTARCRSWNAPSASNRSRSAARRWSICFRNAASR